MLKILVLCLYNWKEEAGNGREAILFIQKVLSDRKNKGRPMAERVPRVLLIEAPDQGKWVFARRGYQSKVQDV